MKSSDSLLIYWLQMTSIFSVTVRICRNQFKCNCLRNKNLYHNFLLHFWRLHQILNNFKRWGPSYLVYFRNYILPKTWLGKYLKSPVTEPPSTVVLLKISKHLRNLHDSTSIILFIPLGKIEFENGSVSNI